MGKRHDKTSKTRTRSVALVAGTSQESSRANHSDTTCRPTVVSEVMELEMMVVIVVIIVEVLVLAF